MGLDNFSKITRSVEEITTSLQGVAIPFEVAADITNSLRFLSRAGTELSAERNEFLNIIESLMANWPHTEVNKVYKADPRRIVYNRPATLAAAAQLLETNGRAI